jgi:hypothetical protein
MDFDSGPEGDRFKLERRRTPRPSCSAAEGAEFLPLALDVFTVRGGSSSEVTVFRTPEIFANFGLPPSLQRQILDT